MNLLFSIIRHKNIRRTTDNLIKKRIILTLSDHDIAVIKYLFLHDFHPFFCESATFLKHKRPKYKDFRNKNDQSRKTSDKESRLILI